MSNTTTTKQRTEEFLRSKEFRAICDRLVASKATLDDALIFIRVELEDALNNVPPADEPIDTWHAGCAVLRAYGTLGVVVRQVTALRNDAERAKWQLLWDLLREFGITRGDGCPDTILREEWASLREHERTVKSITAMLGWLNDVPRETLEAHLRSLRERDANLVEENRRLAAEFSSQRELLKGSTEAQGLLRASNETLIARVTTLEAALKVECTCRAIETCERCEAVDAVLSGKEIPARFDFRAHLQRQRAFSEATFGPDPRTASVVDHIRKELIEIEAQPRDLGEWIDVVILALDGAWRAGYSPDEIIAALESKQTKNEAREWPDWRTAPADRAIEHVKPIRQEQASTSRVVVEALTDLGLTPTARICDVQRALRVNAPTAMRLLSLREAVSHVVIPSEVCICAALRLDDGRVIRGHRHDDCIHTARKREKAGQEIGPIRQEAQGFVTSHGRFVGREEGAELQNAAGIVSADTGLPIKGELFSEDLY